MSFSQAPSSPSSSSSTSRLAQGRLRDPLDVTTDLQVFDTHTYIPLRTQSYIVKHLIQIVHRDSYTHVHTYLERVEGWWPVPVDLYERPPCLRSYAQQSLLLFRYVWSFFRPIEHACGFQRLSTSVFWSNSVKPYLLSYLAIHLLAQIRGRSSYYDVRV